MFSSQAQNPSQAQAQAGPELQEVATEQIGFQTIAGESKLRIVPSWPSENLPKPTSSLLSIASRQELLAAAGPDTLVIGETPKIREAFTRDAPAENNVNSFTPALSFQIPRLSQVAFSSDETTLTLCAAEGGGLAVYDVASLKQNNKEPAFQIPTNGIAVRALVPNPAPELGHYLAVVLEQGQLMIANLKDRKFDAGPNGSPIIKEGVSCVAWSNKGKALTAGLGDGTAVQLKANGEVMVDIPRCPQLPNDLHVSGISWLDNEHWIMIYAPSQFSPDCAPDSTYAYVTRQKNTQNFMFQKLQDPCAPFGMNRSPAHHFIARMREFKPALSDALILASTAAGDIGMITNHATPLSTDPTAAGTGGQYTTTAMSIDTRRVQMPSDASLQDTSAIGMALDLSSKELVNKPIPTEEIEQSATPLPGLVILNNEGVLCYWWFVYNQSIRERQGYSGLVALAGQPQQPTAPPASAFGGQQSDTQQTGASMFGASQKPQTTFGQPSTPAAAFGKPAFGSTTTPQTTGGFGGISALGGTKSPWGGAMQTSTPSKTTGPVFGSTTTPQNQTTGGFGGVSAMGANQSPWAVKPAGPAFGSQQNNTQQQPSASVFGKPAFGSTTTPQATGGFGGLSALGGSKSPWGAATSQASTPTPAAPAFAGSGFSNLGPSFGSTMSFGSSFNEPKSAWNTPSLSKDPSGNAGRSGVEPEKSPEVVLEDLKLEEAEEDTRDEVEEVEDDSRNEPEEEPPVQPQDDAQESTRELPDDDEPPLPPFVLGNQEPEEEALPVSPAGSSPVDLGKSDSGLSSPAATPTKPSLPDEDASSGVEAYERAATPVKEPSPSPVMTSVDKEQDVATTADLGVYRKPSEDKSPAHVPPTPTDPRAEQCEILHADITSMIDDLGANAASMTSWVSGHESYPNHERTYADLDDEDANWTLIELPDFARLISELGQDLEDDRLNDIGPAVKELLSIRRECIRMEQGHFGLQEAVKAAAAAESDPEQVPTPARRSRHMSTSPFKPQSAAALTPQQTRTLLDLRKSYSTTLQKLGTLEGLLSELRVSQAVAGVSAGAMQEQELPTVANVIATIRKMTDMAMRRSADLDVLESRLKKLREGRGLAEKLGAMSLSKEGRFEVPEASDDGEEERRDAKIDRYIERERRRKMVIESLRRKVKERGPRVYSVA